MAGSVDPAGLEEARASLHLLETEDPLGCTLGLEMESGISESRDDHLQVGGG